MSTAERNFSFHQEGCNKAARALSITKSST